MPLLAIPNISVGAPGNVLDAATTAVVDAGARLLDIHSDRTHNRSVLTVTGERDTLVSSMVALADACRAIDLAGHVGVHPRVGALDVCPFVPYLTEIDEAIDAAHIAGSKIAERVDAPVFFYGRASARPENVELPNIRWGGTVGLASRMAEGLQPDHGPTRMDPRYGAVLVGARGPLIAFNVWIEGDVDEARAAATAVRERGLVRSLGLDMGEGHSQVSMNLIAPEEVGIEEAFSKVDETGVRITATEIVGLVEDRFLPDPDAKVARLLVEPGHSLESALSD
jgi:glutamate formiminotransferase